MNNNTQWGNFRSDDVDGISEIYRLLKKLEVAINAGFQGNSGWTDGGTNVSLTTSTDTVTIPSQLTVGGNATAQGKLIMLEDSDNGAHGVTIQPPASLAASYTLTLPADDGNSSQFLQTNGSGTLTWATVNGFTIDAGGNMYAGTTAGDSITVGETNFLAGIGAGTTISTGSNHTIVGNNSDVTPGTFDTSTILGSFCSVTGPNGVALGSGATAGEQSVAITATVSHTNSIGIGYNANSTANNQLILGGGGGTEINDAYIGGGVVTASPPNVVVNATGGLGTNTAGASITIAGGKGTGNATTGGDINFATSDAGGSGTTLQSLTTKFTIKKSGSIEIPKTIDTSAGDSVTIDKVHGRFRKDTTGTTFTLTNAYITANSTVHLTPCQIDATATSWGVAAGAGSAVITFNAAPTANFDMNFLVIN